MRTPRFSSVSRSVLIGACLFAVGGAQTLIADDGGGSGDPRSPYGLRITVSVSDVEKMFDRADRNVTAAWSNGGQSERWQKVGFAYLGSSKEVLKPGYSIRGTIDTGPKAAIRLSQIRSLTVKRYDADRKRVLVEVDQFPAISPRQIVEARPTYRALEERFTKRVLLWLTLKDDIKRNLALVNVKESSDPSIKPVVNRFPLAQLSEGARITFAGDRRLVWWGIPSVANSAGYPYRLAVQVR